MVIWCVIYLFILMITLRYLLFDEPSTFGSENMLQFLGFLVRQGATLPLFVSVSFRPCRVHY
jgi:hypothetical protein